MWNATLLCTKVYKPLNTRNFVEGNTYEVREGRLIDGNNDISMSVYENLKQIKESFYADFKEVKSAH